MQRLSDGVGVSLRGSWHPSPEEPFLRPESGDAACPREAWRRLISRSSETVCADFRCISLVCPHASRPRSHTAACQKAEVDVYIASDSATVKGEVRAFLERTPAASCSFRVIGMDDSVSQQASDAHRFDRPGEIQGMAGKVGQMKGAEAKEATLDILFDL